MPGSPWPLKTGHGSRLVERRGELLGRPPRVTSIATPGRSGLADEAGEWLALRTASPSKRAITSPSLIPASPRAPPLDRADLRPAQSPSVSSRETPSRPPPAWRTTTFFSTFSAFSTFGSSFSPAGRRPARGPGPQQDHGTPRARAAKRFMEPPSVSSVTSLRRGRRRESLRTFAAGPGGATHVPAAPGRRPMINGLKLFWRRRVRDPIVSLLGQGLTPETLALSFATGLVLGVFRSSGHDGPVPPRRGRLPLNHVALQLANHLAYPCRSAHPRLRPPRRGSAARRPRDVRPIASSTTSSATRPASCASSA